MRFRALALSCAALAVPAAPATAAAPIHIAIRSESGTSAQDRELAVPAVMSQGRVLAPMREVFAALGASVVYSAKGRRIDARSIAHRVELAIGAHEVRIDGLTQALDVPARVVGLRTFVPLRLIAQSFGAVVAFDRATRRVLIVPVRAQSATTPSHVTVASLKPEPHARIASAYPAIGATVSGRFGGPIPTVRLAVDGTDVTGLTTLDGTTLTYIPRDGLAEGTHAVVISGSDDAGAPFQTTWSFDTTVGAASDAPAGAFGNSFAFFTDGASTFYPGDFMRFTLVAPPGGNARVYLCGLPFTYPLFGGFESTYYRATIPAPLGYVVANCPVTAVYTSATGVQTIVPYPVYVSLFTQMRNGSPQATPSPRSAPRQLPPAPRRFEPSPAPRPLDRMTPAPIVTPPPASTPRPAPPPQPAIATPKPPQRTPIPRPQITAPPS